MKIYMVDLVSMIVAVRWICFMGKLIVGLDFAGEDSGVGISMVRLRLEKE